jgi:hypothetical protein
MLTVRVMPPPVTETVPVRWLVDVLAVAVTLIEPLLLPEAGEMVSHATLLLAVQLTLEVMAMDLLSPEAVKSSDDGETVNDLAPGILKSLQTSAMLYAPSVPAGTCSVTADIFTPEKTLLFIVNGVCQKTVTSFIEVQF